MATDSKEIFDVVVEAGGEAFFSETAHDCGSNRIAEAAEHMDAEIIINVQGDEPFTNKKDLNALIQVFKDDQQKRISMASLKHRLEDELEVNDPNNVKVITDLSGNAIYFSRSVIPYRRDLQQEIEIFKHIGIYAFRKEALLDFYYSDPTPLELTEKIECIRYLEHGKSIKMVETPRLSIGIDTPEDLIKARSLWNELNAR